MIPETGRTPFAPQREVSRDEEEFNIFMPYSRFGGWILEGETLFEAQKAFGIGRLQNINQLSFITLPGPPGLHYDEPFSHTRFDHSLTVAGIAQEIALQNNASDDFVVQVITAGIAHDRGTPAFGDAAKKLDPANLHEEEHWFDPTSKEMGEFLEKYDISAEVLDGIIHNQGLPGHVLDVADRITYVMKDLYKLVGSNIHASELNRWSILTPFLDILREDPNVGDLYKEVEIDWESERLFFTDPERLGRFLRLRGLLHQRLYQHPESMGRDLYMARILQPLYRPEREEGGFGLTPDDLRKLDDYRLLLHLTQFYGEDGRGLSQVFIHNGFRWKPQHIVRAQTKELATTVINYYERHGHTTIGSYTAKGFNPATSLLVQTPDGIKPFHEYDPDAAEELQRMSESVTGIYLYFTRLATEDPMVQRVLSMTTPLLQ